MTRTRSNPARWLALAAVLSFAAAVVLARVGLPEFAHRIHPLALRGASGLPGAMLFNAFAFLLPGLALVLVAHVVRARLAGGWVLRIGLSLVQLSALAFCLQGSFPLALEDIDSAANRRHVLAWMLWWIAFVPGACLLAVAWWKQRKGMAMASLAAALLVPVVAVVAPIDGWAGLAQRLAFCLWFGWWLLLAGMHRAD